MDLYAVYIEPHIIQFGVVKDNICIHTPTSISVWSAIGIEMSEINLTNQNIGSAGGSSLEPDLLTRINFNPSMDK